MKEFKKKKKKKCIDPDTLARISMTFGFRLVQNYLTWGHRSPIDPAQGGRLRIFQGMSRIDRLHALEGGGGVDNPSIPK